MELAIIVTGATASIINNILGTSVSIDDNCGEGSVEATVKAANVGAEAVNMINSIRAGGDPAYTNKILNSNIFSNSLGLLQFGLKWKDKGWDSLNAGDFIAAASSLIGLVGRIAPSLSPVGAILSFGSLLFNFSDPYGKDHKENMAACRAKKDHRDQNPNLTDAKNASCPIILDLNGDGIKTTGIASWRYFDHDQSGFAEMTAWADKNDGILAFDLNGNGKIDDGREIFGNNTLLPDGTLAPHGYAALAQYDSNHDGKIDSHDEIWEKLRVWRDKNEDAKTGKNELHTLDDLGIAAINLNAEEVSETDEAGNRVTHRATVTKTDGTTMASADVWFNVNTAQTRYLGDETVSEDIAALPNVKGFGNVPSLHVAMNKDSKLKEMVETYLSADSEHRDALLPEIIYK